MRGLLPEAILARRKMGFPVPLGRWFRHDFRPQLEEFVTGKRAIARGLFQPEFLRRLVHEHVEGAADHTERLWTLVNFEMWQRRFLDGEPLKGALPEIEETPQSS
jgi:asparagine synthase (glutamine-hydrolysing)